METEATLILKSLNFIKKVYIFMAFWPDFVWYGQNS